MRLSGSTHSLPVAGRLLPAAAWWLLLVLGVMLLAPRLAAQQTALTTTTTMARERAHESDQWKEIEQHLPNPATATPQALELQADILRARRFPDDALDYYRYALDRGGNRVVLLNKLGLTELEMRNVELARAYFQRVVKINRRFADAWNNLGAVEYLDHGAGAAVSDYKHAIKLDRRQAVFHANLATADFETRDFKAARREMSAALVLEPGIFDKDANLGGVEAHVLTSEDRARFSFEMARLYAHSGQQDAMLHALARAAEFGMDVRREMMKDPALAKFESDPRVLTLVHNALLLREGRDPTVSASADAPLPKPTVN